MSVVVGFVFGGWDVSDGSEESGGVEPVDPFQGGVFDVVEVFPWSSLTDDFGLEEPDHRFGEGVVMGVADRRHGGLMPASASRSVYRIDRYWPGIGVVDETLRVAVEPVPDGLFEGVEGQVGAQRRGGPPPDDPSRVSTPATT